MLASTLEPGGRTVVTGGDMTMLVIRSNNDDQVARWDTDQGVTVDLPLDNKPGMDHILYDLC